MSELSTAARVTVLMPVWNAGPFVKAAVESVLGQTFRDFLLVAIDDASTDRTADILYGIGDTRLILRMNPKNRGIARTLNEALGSVGTEYVARMDADDICEPDRLARQLAFLDARPGVGVCGTWVRLFGDQPGVIERRPSSPEVLRAFLLFDNPLFHPTVMMRRDVIERNGLRYDPAFSRTEDYDLWARAARVTDLDNVPVALVRMRGHRANVTNTTRAEMSRQTGVLLRRELSELGVDATEEQLAMHHRVGRGKRCATRGEAGDARAWLEFLTERNHEVCRHGKEAFATAAGMVWFRLCRNSTPLGMAIWRQWRDGNKAWKYSPPAEEMARFVVSMAWHVVRGSAKQGARG